MKLTRLALTITFSPVMDEGEEIDQDTHLKQFAKMLYRSAKSKSFEQFRDDLHIWHTMHGFVAEEDIQDNTVEQVDRALVHHMNVNSAKQILTSAAAVQAMLTTFAQLKADDVPGIDLIN